MGERAWGPKEKYFLYRHTDGGFHTKRHFAKGDVDEMVESDFVAELWEITEEQWVALKRELTPEEKVSKVLSELDPRTFPNGIIRKLK